jgi:hypothetical protein
VEGTDRMAEPPPGYDPSFGSGPPYFDPADPLISADYAGWWRRTLAVIARVWPQLLVLELIGAVLVFLSEVALSRLVRLSVFASDEGLGARIVTPAAAALVEEVLQALITLMVVYLVILAAAGRQPTLGAVVNGAARRWLPMLGWSVLGGLLIGVGLLMCLLPGIYFALVLTLLAPVIAVERREGIGRCFELFHARPGAAWSRIGTVVAILVLVGGALDLVIDRAVGPTLLDPAVDVDVLALALSGVAGAAVMVLTGPLTVTAYADLRARLEPTSTAGLTERLLRP